MRNYFFNANKEKKFNFAAKLDAATLAGARVYVYGQRSIFHFKMEPHFSDFSLNLDFQDSKMKLQTKEL